MIFKDLIKEIKANRFWAIIIVLLVAYFFLSFLFPGRNPINLLLSHIAYPLLILVEHFANYIFIWTGSALSIHDQQLILNELPVNEFTIKIMYKKIILFFIITLWLTRSSTRNRIIFSAIYLILGFLSTTAYNVALAFEITDSSQPSFALSIAFTLVFICLNTTMLIWYLINRKAWVENLSGSKGIGNLLEKKLPDILKVVYVYAMVLFSLGYFDFDLLIGIILRSSHSIVEMLGYHAFIEDNMLIGENGSVSLYRTCLGIMTMFLFAAVVYITGNEKKKGWIFLAIGVLVLNIANIMRITLVFLHLQKHGDYMLTMDIHDLYNYATYFIVFILWVIWFEKYMDLETIKGIRLFRKI